MPAPSPAWPEIESRIDRSELRWGLFLGLSALCLSLIGGILGWTGGMDRDFGLLPFLSLFAGLAAFGLFVVTGAIYEEYRPRLIRHAAPTVLADVPTEPLIEPVRSIDARLRLTWIEENRAWSLRPFPGMRESLKRRLDYFLFAIWVIGSIAASAALLTYSDLPWPIAVFAPMLAVGALLVLIYAEAIKTMKGIWDGMVTMTVPKTGESIVLETGVYQEPIGTFKYGFTREPICIPRDQVVAIQICPVIKPRSEPSHGVQGILVCKEPGASGYTRHLLLTCEQRAESARLMAKLASHLQIPFLFHADETGWTQEKQRVKVISIEKKRHATVTPKASDGLSLHRDSPHSRYPRATRTQIPPIS